MSTLPVKRACELDDQADQPQWLVEGLWTTEAVGILGGEPKCCKSFLALDLAVSVASGKACLRRFPVSAAGPVLLFPAEDSPGVVRQRLEGICAAAQVTLEDLPIYIITAPRLLLDQPKDRQGLQDTVDMIKPSLLILDPLIRLHRIDENASKDVAPLLGYLRELQRTFHTAVLLVHHTRKTSNKRRSGQALRGSSDLHGWGDSYLYLRRSNHHLTLSMEHRAAPSRDDIHLQLVSNGVVLALSVVSSSPIPDPRSPSPTERIIEAMAKLNRPASAREIRNICCIRTATLCHTLDALIEKGRVLHDTDGYHLVDYENNTPVSTPTTPIDTVGNGNGKHHPTTQLHIAFKHQSS